jgi:uncharacterized protein (DUF1015 family)
VTEVAAFRALRYDPARVDLDRVIAPPYDVISPEERVRLWDRDPHCAIRLVLTREATAEAAADYRDAARRLAEWRRLGILTQDPRPAVYVLRQRYTDLEGQARTREGFFALLHLEDYARRVVLPHERTLAGPKLDRLKLLRAARANLSSVLLLYEDPERSLTGVLAAATRCVARARDDAGILHELFPLEAPEAVAAITGFLRERPVVIADGHHRYETALLYRDEQRRGNVRREDPFEWTLGYFANAYAEGTELRPIHRVLRKAPPPTAAAWREGLPGWRHESVALPGPEALPALLARHLAPHRGRPAFAADDGSGVLHVFVRLADAGAALPVRVLHEEVVGGVFGISEDAVREGALAFPKDALEAARMVRRGEGAVALYLNPLEPADVFRVTAAGELLPQKSTFFYPKLPTGMVFRAHEAEP